MRVGPLRHRVLIQSKDEIEDHYGSPEIVWRDGPTVWASIRAQSAKEIDAANQTLGETTYEIIMRYRELDYTFRIAHGGKIYDVREVHQGNIPDMTRVICTVGTTDG